MQIYAPTGEPSPEVPTPLRRYIYRHSQLSPLMSSRNTSKQAVEHLCGQSCLLLGAVTARAESAVWS
eukprot:6589452-Prymnesium_polylepis.1